jgi:hypothetical protein
VVATSPTRSRERVDRSSIEVERDALTGMRRGWGQALLIP